MSEKSICNECGSVLAENKECRDYINEMIMWDFEDFNGVGKVHHLTVLSYNLQHPSVYSQKGLENAIISLEEFLFNPKSFSKHDEINRINLSSNVRDWKITGTLNEHAKYKFKPTWSIVASDIVNAGLDEYTKNVEKWGESVLQSLKNSGNI